MKGIVDRFEGSYAVVELEKKGNKNIPREWFPKGLKEGDCVIIDTKNKACVIDIEQTEERHKNIESLMADLFKE